MSAMTRRADSDPVNASRAGANRVGLHREDVVVRLLRVGVAVGVGAAQAVLLVGEQHQPHRPAGLDAELLHQAQPLPGDDAPDGVVRGAGGGVPRVEVAADEHDLVRPLAADELANHVGVSASASAPLHLQPHPHRPAAADDAVDAHGVLHRDGRRRNPRCLVAVLHAAGVRCPQPIGPTDRSSMPTAPCCAAMRAPPGPIDHRLAVVGVGHVEETMRPFASANAAAVPPCSRRPSPRPRGPGAASRCCRRGRAGESRGAVGRGSRGSPLPGPSAAPSPSRCGRSRGRPPSSSRRPTGWRDRGSRSR